MIIGVDARLICYRRGIGNYVYNLLRALAKLPGRHTFFLYVDRVSASEYAPLDPRFVVKVLRPPVYPVWEQLILPVAAIHDRLDVLHCPANTAPLFLPKKIKLVLSIMDVIYMLPSKVLPRSPSIYQRLGRFYLRWLVPAAANRADRIVTISDFSRKDICKYLNLSEDSVQVIPLAPAPACGKINNADTLKNIRAKYGLAGKFIMALAAVDPRKNTIRVMEAYSLFAKTFPGRCKLLLAGLSDAAKAPFYAKAEKLGIRKDIVITGFIPEDDLISLYNAAEMLVYPSLYEGFGLPILEAMSCGAPVVTSPSGSIPEVAGEAVLYADPRDAASIAAAMEKLAADEGCRERLVKAGFERARRFSWDTAARDTMKVYEDSCTLH